MRGQGKSGTVFILGVSYEREQEKQEAHLLQPRALRHWSVT